MGKQIRIYLADNTATGIRHAEITNWSGQALACPRARFHELKDWMEIKRPGVYLLFGTVEESEADAVYIGESEVVLDRLASHLSQKDFWTELVAFTSKDDHLTKGHVKYLESRLIQLATVAGRYEVTNSASPQLPALPRADRDAMEEYLESVRSLLGVLGHRVLDPYTSPATKPSSPGTTAVVGAELVSESATGQQSSDAVFSLQIGGLKARANRTDEGLVVLAGSEAAAVAQSSLSGGYKALREKLIATGTMEHHQGRLRFLKDQLFRSPSQAAAILVGYSINGRDAWRLQDGTTYGTFEQRLSSALIQQLEQ